MNANRFLPPPVRLSQAFDGGNPPSGSGHEVTRRSFLKRTGGATVATLVAWNLASQQAGALAGGSESYSFKMCAISPQNGPPDGDLIGYVSLPPFPNGGYVFLYFIDSGCYFQQSSNHAAFHIDSMIRIRAEAWIPAKQDQNPAAPWVLNLPNDIAEENRFVFEGSAIVRQQGAIMAPGQYSRDLDGSLPAGSRLDLKLEILSVVRTNCTVTVNAKAWLEGTAAGVTYDSASHAGGYGISMVVENDQPNHAPSECQCAV